MFAAVRATEKRRPQACEESDARSDETSDEVAGADGATEKGGDGAKECADDEDDDELSNDQQRKLHGSILNVITQFVKVNNFKEHEYYGVSEQTLKK